MSGRPKKRSLTLNGHRTSVSLEDAFWDAFCDIAKNKSISINALAAEIDVMRVMDSGLAAALRVYVLHHFQSLAESSKTEATSAADTSDVTNA